MSKSIGFVIKHTMFYLNFKAFLNRKLFTSLVMSTFAASGVVLYGYQAPKLMGISNEMALYVLGVACATAAMIANLMLGTYSLLNMKKNKNDRINKTILSASLIGSVPYGFLCFFSYSQKLSNVLNISLSIIVVLVNAGIGYTALKNVLQSLVNYFGKKHYLKKSFGEQFSRMIGIIIGVFVSTTMYLATCHGLADLFEKFELFSDNRDSVSYGLAILSWFPVAALFANGNQNIAFGLYTSSKNFKKTVSQINVKTILYLAFCLFSGTAIFSMMNDAYDTSKLIPDIFKNADLRNFINHFGIYIALFSTAALSYFSINNLINYLNNK